MILMTNTNGRLRAGRASAWLLLVLLGLGAGPCPPAVAAPFSLTTQPAAQRLQEPADHASASLQANFLSNSFLGNRNRMIQATLVAVLIGIWILGWRRT